MAARVIHINRYPNRRFYCRTTREYVSLEKIEQFVRDGDTVEIRDSQSHDDITRTVLTQLLIERQPEKVALFPTPMLHLMLRANDMMSGFLRSYFLDSLTYLEYLQKHGAAARLSQPLHWLQAWLEGTARRTGLVAPLTNAPSSDAPSSDAPTSDDPAAWQPDGASEDGSAVSSPDHDLAQRLAELEQRLRKLETPQQENPASPLPE